MVGWCLKNICNIFKSDVVVYRSMVILTVILDKEGETMEMHKPVGDGNDWMVANLTQEQYKQIKQLEEQLGLALIAYIDADCVDMDTAPKGG